MKINWFNINKNHLLNTILVNGFMFKNNEKNKYFSKFNCYLKQGIFCKDCKNNYILCDCEEEIFLNFDFIIKWIYFNISNENLELLKYYLECLHNFETVKNIKNYENKLV